MSASLLAAASQLSPKLRAWRRHLHAHPELSFEEHATQRYVREQLDAIEGLQIAPIAKTGLTVTLAGDRPGRCVALRADLDALPIREVAGRSYGSTVPGVMHACGHDVHTTCLLGALRLLSDRRSELRGTVRAVFQPGEELLPGGATHVIADGFLDRPRVDAIVGLHVDPSLPVGSYGVRPGQYMASTDELYLTLRGPGGHAAMAHTTVDLVAAAAQVITALQQVASRKAPPEVPTVLSFGKVSSEGGATNVLTTAVRLEGTFRTYDEAWRERARVHIERIARMTGEAMGAEVEVDIRRGYPALNNDEGVTAAVRRGLVSLVGEGDVAALGLRPTAEDFAWYLQRVPGCFFRLGVRNEARGITSAVHTPSFDVDEGALAYGAAGMASAAIELLG